MTASAPSAAETFVLRDGRRVVVRPVRGDDESALEVFLGQLVPATRRLRCFTACCDLRAQAHLSAFFAGVLPEHREILAVFHEGFAPTQHSDTGIVKVEPPTSNWTVAECPGQ